MRSNGVVVMAPALDYDPCFLERVEDLTVAYFISYPRLKALDEAVLPWAARRDVGRTCSNGGDPFLHGRGDELRPVAPTEGIRGGSRDSGARSFSLQARTDRGGHGQSEFL